MSHSQSAADECLTSTRLSKKYREKTWRNRAGPGQKKLTRLRSILRVFATGLGPGSTCLLVCDLNLDFPCVLSSGLNRIWPYFDFETPGFVVDSFDTDVLPQKMISSITPHSNCGCSSSLLIWEHLKSQEFDTWDQALSCRNRQKLPGHRNIKASAARFFRRQVTL